MRRLINIRIELNEEAVAASAVPDIVGQTLRHISTNTLAFMPDSSESGIISAIDMSAGIPVMFDDKAPPKTIRIGSWAVTDMSK